MKRFSIAVACLLFAASGFSQAPVAGFSVDSLTMVGPQWPGEFEIFISDQSTGNPTSVNYYLIDPFNPGPGWLFPWGTGAGNWSTWFSNSTLPPSGMIDYELYQVVSNGSGSDTAMVVQHMGCNGLTYAPALSIGTNITANSTTGAFDLYAAPSVNDDSWQWYNFSLNGVSHYPSAPITAPGTYQLCMIVSGGTCVLQLSNCDSVAVASCLGNVQAQFASQHLGGKQFSFSDQSQTNALPGYAQYLWDFGDGSTDTSASPTHTYATADTFSVCLTVMTACDTATYCSDVEVQNPPMAAFAVDSLVLEPYPAWGSFFLHLDDQSAGSPTTVTYYAVDPFNSGMWPPPLASGAGYQSINYQQSQLVGQGLHQLYQVVSNAFGADTAMVLQDLSCAGLTKTLTMGVNVNLQLDWAQGNFTVGGTPFSNDDSFMWSGAVISGPGVVDGLYPSGTTIQGPGPIEVCITLTGGSCAAQLDACDTVDVPPCQGAVTTAFNAGVPNGLSVQFTEQSTSNAFPSLTQYHWTFGDGSTASMPSPSHTFAAPGTYNVCLTVSTPCDTTTFCDNVTVTAVGIEKPTQVSLDIYPNPNRGRFKVDAAGVPAVAQQWKLVDAQGKVVLERFWEAGTLPKVVALNPAGLRAGIYQLVIQGADLFAWQNVIIR